MHHMHKLGIYRWLQLGLACLWVTSLIVGSVVSARAEPAQPTDPAFPLYAPLILNDKCTVPQAPNLFGVQYYGNTSSSSPYYNDFVGTGATWLRDTADWALIEPSNTTPDQYHWADLDAAVGMAAEQCATIVLTIGSNPTWASHNFDGPIDKVGMDEFVQFVTAVAERYDGDGIQDAPNGAKVNFFEMYNEPDGGPALNQDRWGLHGDLYAAMLKAIYPAVKAANPAAQIVFGGLAYDFFTDADPITPSNNGPFVRKFPDDVFKNGGGAYIDYMNFHYYPLFGANWTKQFPKDGPGLADKANAISALMHKYGVNKPMIITETGWHNNASIPQGSDTLQVRLLVQLYTQALVGGVKMVAWWPLMDAGGSYPYNSGLVTKESQGKTQRKPAFAAYQVMVRELGAARFVAEQSFAVDIKSYKLQDDAHGRTLYVAWTNPTNPLTVFGSAQSPYVDTTRTATIALPAKQVGVYDAFWKKVATVSDKGDGKSDNRVTVTINGDPQYIVVEEN